MSQVTKICIKRLQGDAKMLAKHPVDDLEAYQDEKDMLIWYFLLKGPVDTHYQGGLYIGKIMHSPEYPFKAPDFMMLTPSGRFDIGRKICLTNSGYHSENWSAMWNIRSILLGFLSIMVDDNTSGISHIKKSEEERKVLAQNSRKYNEDHLKDIFCNFTRLKESEKKEPEKKEADNTTEETVEKEDGIVIKAKSSRVKKIKKCLKKKVDDNEDNKDDGDKKKKRVVKTKKDSKEKTATKS